MSHLLTSNMLVNPASIRVRAWLLRRAQAVAPLRLPCSGILVNPNAFLAELFREFSTRGEPALVPSALALSACMRGETRYQDALRSRGLSSALRSDFLAFEAASRSDLVLVERDPDASGTFTELELFKAAPGNYLLPALAADSLNLHGTWPTRPCDLFLSAEEADTTLSLWTPGSADAWCSLAYAHATAQAL